MGTGTSGEVFRAYDTKHRSMVALKTLHRADPAALYRFKNEFRALTDVTHPNLVQLYELLLDDQRWFFTMELVEGCDFLEYCRDGASRRDGDANGPSGPEDPAQVHDAVRQLAVGLSALHAGRQTALRHQTAKHPGSSRRPGGAARFRPSSGTLSSPRRAQCRCRARRHAGLYVAGAGRRRPIDGSQRLVLGGRF